MSVSPSTRLTAEERREAVLEAAMREFAIGGLAGTSTDDVARRAGISHPYLFRLFGTKKELFLAVVARCFRRTLQTFEQAAADADEKAPGAVLRAMGKAYVELLADREMLLLQLHSYAACADPDVRAVVRRGYGEIYDLVDRVVGGDDDAVRRFFATGMLLNVIAAMKLGDAPHEQWARRLVGGLGKGGR